MSNSTPTPPLIQQQSTDDKVGLMLGQGRGRCAVVQILTWISFFRYSSIFQFNSLSPFDFQDSFRTRHWTVEKQVAGSQVRERCSSPDSICYVFDSHIISFYVCLDYLNSTDHAHFSCCSSSDKYSMLQSEYDELEGEHERLTARHSKLIQDIDNKEAHWKDRSVVHSTWNTRVIV